MRASETKPMHPADMLVDLLTARSVDADHNDPDTGKFLSAESYSNVLAHLGRAAEISKTPHWGRIPFESVKFCVRFDRELKNELMTHLARLEELAKHAMFEGVHEFLSYGESAKFWLEEDFVFDSGVGKSPEKDWDKDIVEIRERIRTRIRNDKDQDSAYSKWRENPQYVTLRRLLPSWKLKQSDEIRFKDVCRIAFHLKTGAFEKARDFVSPMVDRWSGPTPLNQEEFKRWLESLRTVRNKCAHSLPLFGWDPQRVYTPAKFRWFDHVPSDALFRQVLALRIMLVSCAKESADALRDGLLRLQSSSPEHSEAFRIMGFPPNWDKRREWA